MSASPQHAAQAVFEAADVDMVTVALRRLDASGLPLAAPGPLPP